MRVTRLLVRDFRSHSEARVELAERLTVLCGPNGAGKTNLLEALYFGCVGRSCRTANEREMVRAGRPLTHVRVEGYADDGPHTLEVGFAPGEPKRARADGALVERLVDVAFRPLVAVFLSERLELVRGAPAPRRAHIDQLAGALWPASARARSEYARALGQRNAAIARVRRGAARTLLDPWDAELARHGVELMADRRRSAAALEEPFGRRADELGLPDPVTVRYRPRSSAEDASALVTELEERRESDLERGFSTHGPHRDDLELRHGGRPLRTFGSQGQQRVALLALLFAERDALLAHGRSALMLLDDVMSELDAERRRRLADVVLEGGQAVVTTTEAAHVPGHDAPGAVVVPVGEAVSAAREPAVVAGS